MSPWSHPLVVSMLDAIEHDLKSSTSLLQSPPYEKLYRMIEHHFGWDPNLSDSRGKRVRPLLTLLVCNAILGEWRIGLPVASSIELIHNFSLLHDDIQDRSSTRRGQPTVWKLWGDAQAINTGDALFVLAQISSARLAEHEIDPQIILDVRHSIDEACLALTMGQFLDLAFEQEPNVSREQYLTMIHGKTAHLLAAATASGAQLAMAEPSRCEAFSRFGEQLGMAFQILDDILGISGKPERTGKPTGDDLIARKKTLPILYGIEVSPTFSEMWHASSSEEPTVEAMTTELNACGALEFSVSKVAQYSESALQALDQALPRDQDRELLHSLTLDLMHRDQ